MIEALHQLIGSPDTTAVCLLDADRRIISCNEAMGRMAGRSPDQLVGLVCCQALHGANKNAASCPFSRMSESKKPEKGVVRIGERNVEAAVDPLLDASGRIVHALHTFHDSAKRAEAGQSLVKLQKLEHVSEISRGIAHDLNNILAAAGGMLEITTRNRGSVMSSDLVGDIQSAMARAGKLCRQLMSVSAGSTPRKSVVLLSEIIRESAELGVMGSRHELVCEMTDGLWPCLAQEEQIAQVVLNLVMNARQASRPGNAIRVRAQNVRESVGHLGFGNYVKIEVQDSGTGIASHHLGSIFKPFFTTKEHGTGLGLATVDFIVREHMGHVSVVSEAGSGTTFTVYLPAMDPAALNSTRGGTFTEVLRNGCFCLDLKAGTKEGVIREMIDDMSEAGMLKDRDATLKAVFYREGCISTGMQNGVALPHGKTDAVDELVVCFGMKREGVDFESLDGLPAKILVMTISPLNDTGRHVRYLAEISKLLNSASVRERILNARNPTEIVGILIPPSTR